MSTANNTTQGSLSRVRRVLRKSVPVFFGGLCLAWPGDTSWITSKPEVKFPIADDLLGSNLVPGEATQAFAVFDLFGIRRIINPAVSTANITNLSPKENDPPVRV